MALDWFSGLVGYDASTLALPTLIEVSPEGVINWQVDRWATARGSYSASVQVCRESATEGMRRAAESMGFLCSPLVLKLSGNPTKFLQGHNVFGPSVSELGPVVRALVRRLPVELRPPDAVEELLPSVHRSRVDVAVSVDLGGHRLVHEWLRQAETSTRSRHGRAMASGSTVYWGKQSRRWSLKAYCKFCELAEHPPAERYGELRAYAEGLLRIELTLRRMELKDRASLSEDVVWEYYRKVAIGVKREVADLESPNLPLAVQNVLQLWLDGHNVTWRLSRATFYRYRKRILDELGLDISLPRDDQMGELGRLGFDVEYLRARQVKDVPPALQPLLFRA